MREAGCKFKYLKLLVFALALGGGPGRAELPRVAPAQDLHADARLAEARGLPILLAFTRHDCRYCTQVEADFLVPLLLNDYETNRVLIRTLLIDAGGELRDFDGTRVTPAALAERYGVRLAPTLIFVDAQGRELAERLVGLTTPDFYGGYLEAAIDAATAQLQAAPDRGP
ncbi:MAG: thioredoxin family protein [Gammaproteobacteria bacterium]